MGELLPLEIALLAAAVELRTQGVREFYGFLIARKVQKIANAKMLAAHGTLYKALGRLEGFGLLTSRWEDPAIAAEVPRPLRRLYEITADGERAFAEARVPRPRVQQLSPSLTPS